MPICTAPIEIQPLLSTPRSRSAGICSLSGDCLLQALLTWRWRRQTLSPPDLFVRERARAPTPSGVGRSTVHFVVMLINERSVSCWLAPRHCLSR